MADSTIELMKVHTRDNLADALTKYVGSDELQRHISHTSHEIVIGRHQIAPEVSQLDELHDSQLMIACVCVQLQTKKQLAISKQSFAAPIANYTLSAAASLLTKLLAEDHDPASDGKLSGERASGISSTVVADTAR